VIAIDEAVELFEDRVWRLNNLYTIKDKGGRAIPFRLNEAQSDLLADLHSLNIILKARQMGSILEKKKPYIACKCAQLASQRNVFFS